MRKLTEIFEAVEKTLKLNIQDGSINYISAKQLKEYLETCKVFLSNETKEIVNWLIVNNSSYIAELSTDQEENALAGFFNAGMPKEDHLKELYKAIAVVQKSGRILEIPVFMTEKQFNSVINKEVPLDYVVLALDTTRGRNKAAEKYNPLLIKMCRDWLGKSNLTYDDLMSAAHEGFVWALNGYGKKTDKNKVDLDTIVTSQTFGQYAAWMIRSSILMAIENESKTVREPKSAQKRERQEKGYNRKVNSVSGNRSISKDDEGGKTLFDLIGDFEEASNSLDNEDLKMLRNELKKMLVKEFGQKVVDIFASGLGMFGYEKIKKKDIAKKYDISSSNVSYYNNKIEQFLKKDKKANALLMEIIELISDVSESAGVTRVGKLPTNNGNTDLMND